MDAQHAWQAQALRLLKHAHYLHKSGAGRLALPGQPLRHADGALVQFDHLLVRCGHALRSPLVPGAPIPGRIVPSLTISAKDDMSWAQIIACVLACAGRLGR